MVSDPVSPESPVDLLLLSEWADGVGMSLEELVGRYVKSVTKDMEILEGLIAAGDVQEVFRVAHGAASASANCGMRAIIVPLVQMEQDAREGSLVNAATLLGEARGELQRMLSSLPANAGHGPPESGSNP